MVRNVTLTIDHKSVTVPENTTILEAARSVNINIPTLCYLKDINEIGACRICCVEVEGMERLVPACDNVVADGMVVFTNSAKAREARRINLRLILSHHDTSCTNCTRSGNCTLQQLANDFNMRGTHFPKKLRHEAVDYSTPLIRENDKCVQCLRCIQVCENVQSVKIWDLLGTGSRTVVDASYNRRIQDTECTYCGQCITHCPTAALRERDDTGLVFDAIDDPNTVTVAQVAPAVRAAWAEQFGLDSEFATPKRMVAALRELGFQTFIVDYRLSPYTQEEGALDVARAVRFIRKNADAYGVEPEDIAVMGFSAGGIQAGEFLMHYDEEVNGTALDSSYVPDELDAIPAHASAAGMIYSFYGRLSVGNMDPDWLRKGNLPPTFYVYGTEDPFYRQFQQQYDVISGMGISTGRIVLNGWPHGFGSDGGWVKDYAAWLETIFA